MAILFALDFDDFPTLGVSGAYPTDGSSGQSLNNGVYYDFDELPTGGPGGSPAFSLNMIGVTPPEGGGANPCTDEASCQGYLGFGNPSPAFSAVAQGDPIYVRMYLRVPMAGFNDPRVAGNTGSGWGGKFVILGDGCSPDNARFFANFQSDAAGTSVPQLVLDKNIEGVGPDPINLPTDSEWFAIQILCQTSSTAVATDGTISAWLNTDVEGSPTSTSPSPFAWDSSCLNAAFRCGGYANWMDAAAGGALAGIEVAALEIGDSFDPTWHARMVGPVLVQVADDLTSPWGTDGTAVATFPAPTTVGNTIIATWGVNADLTFTIADNGSGGSNTYGTTTRSPFVSTGGVTQIGYAVVERAASIVTVTASGATFATGYLKIMEWANLDIADLFEDQAQGSRAVANSTHPAGPVTTVIDRGLLIGIVQGSLGAYDGTPGGFTELYDQTGGVAAYKILEAPTTETWTPTSAVNELSSTSLAAFNGLGDAPPPPAGSVPVIVANLRNQGIL